MRVEVCSRVRVQLFFSGRKPGFAEEDDEALPIFARTVGILE